jgi:hypothetical protein
MMITREYEDSSPAAPKNYDSYQAAFQRLLRDLKAEKPQ